MTEHDHSRDKINPRGEHADEKESLVQDEEQIAWREGVPRADSTSRRQPLALAVPIAARRAPVR